MTHLVRASPAQRLLFERLHDVLPTRSHRERQCGSGYSLRGGYDVGDDSIIILKAKQLSRSSESYHHLVAVQEDIVLIADSAHALH